MTYYESAKGLEISRSRALREVRAHGSDAGEFLADMGDRESYRAQRVLDWLGY